MATLSVPPAPFTETEWQELEYECLTDQMSRQLIGETSENQDTLLQEHKEMTEAYNAMAQHKHKMHNTGEWETLDKKSFRNVSHINQKWDYHEMYYDMNAFESDVNAQKIIAAKHQHIPQITMDVNISTKGTNYATGESIVGKVYIPKQMTHFFKGQTKQCVILYNGCEDARKSANIRMPWKCIFVNQ